MTNLWPGGGPMLAVNFDDVEIISYPMLGQPKLNGLRACWDGVRLISRQNEVWSWRVLPEIYEKLRAFSKSYPGIYLDGEIYCHGLRLQEINSIASINRLHAHKNSAKLEFHAFDIVSSDDTEDRQITLAQIYKPWVAVCKINNEDEQIAWMKKFQAAGFEGMILRQFRCPYLHDRTEALIKVKPWVYGMAKIVELIEGKDSFAGKLGAFRVAWGKRTFKIGGGSITIEQREKIWSNQKDYQDNLLHFRFRELSMRDIPIHPQIVKLPHDN